MNALPLADHHCTDLPPGTPPLSEEAAHLLRAQLDHGWSIESEPVSVLYKRFELPDFAAAMNLAQIVGKLAEAENHHPEIRLSWGWTEIRIWTHSVKGLSVNDFILAARIEQKVAENR